MPASTIDTFFACLAMITLVLSAMATTTKLAGPYLNDLSQQGQAEQYQQLASYILLNPGAPSDWGQLKNIAPTSLGLAKTRSSLPYELDIDKVTRMNSANVHSLTYSQLWKSLGAEDVTFQIIVRLMFEIQVSLTSSLNLGNRTAYSFEVAAQKSGTPIESDLSGYVLVEDFVGGALSSTDSNGIGSLAFSVPNSVNGTALLVVFAESRTTPQMAAYVTLVFRHNSLTPLPVGVFTRLSPLNYALNASLAETTVDITEARALTFGYNFTLTERSRAPDSIEYSIPRALDPCPMIIAVTGHNGSTSFAEWASYPQLPLQIGVNFDRSTTGRQIYSQIQIVAIGSAFYEVETRWGGSV